MHFSASVKVTSGSTANTFASVLGLQHADTAGHRSRLRGLHLAGGGGSPQDLQMRYEVEKSDGTTDGTATDSSDEIVKKDGNSVDSRLEALYSTYTVEPTTLDGAPVDGGAFNLRSGVSKVWGPDDAPVWGQDETLLVRLAPGEAVAGNVVVTVEWEEF